MPRTKDFQRRFATSLIIEALRKNGGFIAQTARKLGCARTTLHDRIQKDPVLKATLEEITESFIDMAESGVYRLVEKGDLGACKFVLQTRGRHRGWGDKLETTGILRITIAGIEKDATFKEANAKYEEVLRSKFE